MSDPRGPSAFSAWLDLLRAELRKALSRRGVKLVAVVALGTLLWLSWSNHKVVADNREYVTKVQAAIEDPNSHEQSLKDGPPGKYPYYGPDVTKEEYRKQLESDRTISLARLAQGKPALHPSHSYQITLGWFGTVAGVLLGSLLASTLVGAEFRWGYWKTIATFEPRRGRIVIAKLAAIWILLGIGLVVLLGLSYGLNAVFAEIYDIQKASAAESLDPRFILPAASGPPELGALIATLGVAWLSTGTYSTIAFAAVTWARATLAGPLAALGLLIADGALITPRVTAARHASPVQQIAFLLPDLPYVGGEAVRGVWFDRMDRLVSFAGVGSGSTPNIEELSTIPDWRALLVLAAWITLGTAVAVVGLRSRDLPN